MTSWIFGLAIIAVILVFLEIFLLPGGIVGVIGFLLLLLSTYLASRHYGGLAALGIFAGSGLIMVLSFILFFKTGASKWLILSSTLENAENTKEGIHPGLSGNSLTALRPSGKAIFILNGKEKQIDVVTNGEFIEKDQRIEIIQVEGTRVLVVQKT